MDSKPDDDKEKNRPSQSGDEQAEGKESTPQTSGTDSSSSSSSSSDIRLPPFDMTVQKLLHPEQGSFTSWIEAAMKAKDDVALQFALAMSLESKTGCRESSLNQGIETSSLSESVPEKIISDIDVFGHFHLPPGEFSFGPDEAESQIFKPQLSKEEASTEAKACQTSDPKQKSEDEMSPGSSGMSGQSTEEDGKKKSQEGDIF